MISLLSHIGHGTRNADEVVKLYEDLFGLHAAYDISLPEAGQREVSSYQLAASILRSGSRWRKGDRKNTALIVSLLEGESGIGNGERK